MIFGDHGLFDNSQPLHMQALSIFIGADEAGPEPNDWIHAGKGDDFVMVCVLWFQNFSMPMPSCFGT